MRPTYTTNIFGTNSKVTVQNISTLHTPSTDVTRLRLYSDVDCRIALGANPQADSNSVFIPAGIIEYITTRRGWNIAVIRDGAEDGTLEVTEVTA